MLINTLTYGALGALGAVSVGIHKLSLRTESQVTSSKNPDFLHLQRKFFAVYFLALFGDWLQGPYVYKLYSFYGFPESDIAILYLTGFGASIVFGTATGPLADKYGRKFMCIIFAGLYSLSCVTKISPNFYLLLFGRVLGGIATSVLFSSFESWYVHEHMAKYDFPSEWVSVTLSTATFWNGVLAIGAGIVANFTAELMESPVAPFLFAIPVLVLAGCSAALTWPENTGSPNIKSSWSDGLDVIFKNPAILSLGIVQALFESVMYIFVFLWTPILDPMHPPLGIVFSCFMVCVMIGSSLYTLLLARKYTSEKILTMSCSILLACMCVCVYTTKSELPYLSMIMFLILEVAVGLYFPAIGSLRSELLPDAFRANIINLFRVPMNAITCGALLWLHRSKNSDDINCTMFTMCAILMALATASTIWFSKQLQKGAKKQQLEIGELIEIDPEPEKVHF